MYIQRGLPGATAMPVPAPVSNLRKPAAMLAFLFAAVLMATDVSAGEPHQHGVAQLLVAVEGNTLELEFISPLENLVGFEHAPRNEKERNAMRKLEQRFRDPASLFVPSAAAQCSAGAAQLELPGEHGKNGHADMRAAVVFQCKDVAALKGMELQLFDAFPRLKRVQAQLATANRQSAAELTRRRGALAW